MWPTVSPAIWRDGSTPAGRYDRLVGSGEMGTDIVTRAAMMDGVDVAAIADIDPARAHEAVTIARGTAGLAERLVER